MRQTAKNALGSVVFVLLFCLLFAQMTNLVKVKRTSFPWDMTTKIHGFYSEPVDTLDFVFVGSSEVLTAVVPNVLWDEYGITSYVFGSTQQPLWISYYYIEEALKYQTPLAVVLDVRYIYFHDAYSAEGNTRMALDDLRWSRTKVEAIRAAVPEGERLSYYIEMMKYHGNWESLSQLNFTKVAGQNNPYKGYSVQTHRTEYAAAPHPDVAQTTDIADRSEIGARNLEYLLKIIELSRQRDFQLLLIKTPNGYAEGQRVYNAVGAIAAQEGVPFVNYNTLMDGEPHLSIERAADFTQLLGAYLVQHYAAVDKRQDPAFAAWHEDSRYFRQQLEKYHLTGEGEVDRYLARLDNPHYIVVLAQHTGSADMDGYAGALAALGVQHNFGEHFGYSYIAVLYGGQAVLEEIGIEPLERTALLEGVEIRAVSRGYYSESTAGIYLDGTSCAVNRQGINIVVYDTLLGAVVDSAVIDTASGAPAVERG